MTDPAPHDPAEKLRPVLDQAENSLERHLDAAIGATPENLHEEPTEKLLELEDELLAAARAVERTVTVRRVIEFSACPDESLPAPAEGADGAEGGTPPCLVREFTDARGRPWRVWQVIPGRGRDKAHGERVLGVFSSGWLAFEALDDGSRRRLLGRADGWETGSDEELAALLERATEVPKRTGHAPGGAGASTG